MIDIDKYFTENFEDILECSHNIFKNSEVDSRDVVTELYLHMKKPERVLPENESEVKYWILKQLKNWTWHKGGNPTKVYKTIRRKDDEFDGFVDSEVNDVPSDIHADLLNAGFCDTQVDNIIRCIDVSKGMPLYYKRIFVLYYIDGMTMEQIGQSCGLPKSAIHTQVEKVKTYIKDSLKLNTQTKLFKI